ncbi:MAG TPA: glucose 1-dehydrogenase [Solirubrobacteraceae bacterium]|jgi:NAD(P)-dependent dehydrogenase (short-subunit alcohol dehydrogenase family)|nr:glucose 1-dehydrogenase [Solirubrobacteraceae bacterium]
MGRLDGKVAVITGAAGSIGSHTARRFVSEGARVALTDLDRDALDALVAQLGEGAVALAGDAADSATVERVVALAVERFGGLDVAFANAGIAGVNAPIVEHPEESFRKVLEVNVVGPFLLAKHALRAMRDGGSLIMTSSTVGLTSAPGIAGYATSKHALVGLMRTAMKEVAERGIRVNTIHPGPVDNAFQDAVETDATGQEKGAANEIFNSFIPLGRHADPDEIAQAVVFLASDECRFITGATIAMDGGLSV